MPWNDSQLPPWSLSSRVLLFVSFLFDEAGAMHLCQQQKTMGGVFTPVKVKAKIYIDYTLNVRIKVKN